MRIVHISTSDVGGGAARSAYRLFQGLQGLGQECSMLVRRKFSTDRAVCQALLDDSKAANELERQLRRIRKDCVERNRTAISNTLFSLPAPGYDLSGHHQIQDAEIIHLHWISDFLAPPGIGTLQRLGKPVVWTLHDERAFTGGCHFTAGCRRFETDCKACPQLSLADFLLSETSLRESLQCIGPDLVVVCPSRWLADSARRSALFGRARVEVIPYGIDTEVFKPQRAAARQRLGMEPDGIYLLSGADALVEHRKGFELLADAIRQGMAEPVFREAVLGKRVQFLVFGSNKSLPAMEAPVRSLGRFDSDAALAEIYAACDAFLLPSTEDNLPNTMLESICSGTPVIGFDVGGLPEAIQSGQNGLLVPAGNIAQLARAIRDLVLDPNLRRQLAENCSTEAAARFALREQAGRYLALYGELRGRCQSLRSAGTPVAVQPLTPFGEPFARFYPALQRRARQERRKRFWRKLERLFLPAIMRIAVVALGGLGKTWAITNDVGAYSTVCL